MITKYFAQPSNGNEVEIIGATSFDDACQCIKDNLPNTGSYLVMERCYEMKYERSITVKTGE